MANLQGQTTQDRGRHFGTRTAVGGGVRRAGAAFQSDQQDQDTQDGGAAGFVGTEDLGEEGPQHQGRREDGTCGPCRADAFIVEGFLDVLSGENVGEGESFVLKKRSEDGLE